MKAIRLPDYAGERPENRHFRRHESRSKTDCVSGFKMEWCAAQSGAKETPGSKWLYITFLMARAGA